jgi:hypothetical protein
MVSGDSDALTGVNSLGTLGTVAPNITVALSGIASAGALGTLLPATQQALTGVSSTGATGTILPDMQIPLVGVSSVGATGFLAAPAGDITIALTGVSSQGALGSLTPIAQESGGYEDKKKKKYIVEKNGRLLVFSSKSAALHVLNDTPKIATVAEKVVKKVTLAKPEQIIDLPVIQEYAEVTGMIEQYNSAYNSQHYEALIAMFEQMQDDEDIELLLLSL